MKNLKRALCLFLSLVMCLGMLPMDALAAAVQSPNTGSPEGEYQEVTLEAVREYLDKEKVKDGTFTLKGILEYLEADSVQLRAYEDDEQYDVLAEADKDTKDEDDVTVTVPEESEDEADAALTVEVNEDGDKALTEGEKKAAEEAAKAAEEAAKAAEEAAKAAEEAAKAPEETPVVVAPAEPEQAPVEPEQAPVEPEQAPVEPEQAPVEPEQAPEETPVVVAPAEPEQAPEETPVVTGEEQQVEVAPKEAANNTREVTLWAKYAVVEKVEIPEGATEITSGKLLKAAVGKTMTMEEFFGLLQSSKLLGKKTTGGFLGIGATTVALVPETVTFVVGGEKHEFAYADAATYTEQVTVTESAILLDGAEATVYGEGETEAKEGSGMLAISGPNTVYVGDTIALKGSGRLNHEWSWKTNDGLGKVSLSNTSGETVTVKGESAGKVTITHTYGHNKTETFTVEVKARPAATGISITGSSKVVKGNSINLAAVIEPNDAIAEVAWSSSDASVATVDRNGKVNGVTAGTATITAAITVNGKTITATHDVTVSAGYPANNKQSDNWRWWWPVYWTFDGTEDFWGNITVTSPVQDDKVVTITAGTTSVKYTGSSVNRDTALKDSTANAGEAIEGGFNITVDPGYYLESCRLVCYNHYGCGQAGAATQFGADANGDYLATINAPVTGPGNPGTLHFDHGFDYMSRQPLDKPENASGLSDSFPFYLAIKVVEDKKTYGITYNWGDRETELSGYTVPAAVTGLKRNQEQEVAEPNAEAVAAALAAGWMFDGWKVTGTGYKDSDPAVKYPGTVTIKGGNLTLTAQWKRVTPIDPTEPVPDPVNPEERVDLLVSVKCGKDVTHDKMADSKVLADTYKVTTELKNKKFYCVVTINSDEYVKLYNEAATKAHTLTGPKTATFEFVYNDTGSTTGNDAWKLVGETPVDGKVTRTFNVVCADTATVTYNGNGGKTARNETEVTETGVEVGKNYTVAADTEDKGFTKDGYTFAGWMEAANGTTTVGGATKQLTASGLTFYAKWVQSKPDKPNLTKSFDGETPTSVKAGETLTYKLEITLNGSVPVSGFTVVDDKFATNKVVSVKAGENDLEGTWNAATKTFTITGEALTSGTITVTYTYVVDEGDVVNGKITNSAKVKVLNGETESEPSDVVTSDDVPVEYTITYVLNGGALAEGVTNPETYTKDTDTFTLNNPSKAGYTFTGWTGSNGTTALTSVSVEKGTTGNLTYTANWEENAPVITVSKTHDKAEGAIVVTGNTITYTVTINPAETNTGLVKNVQITDAKLDASKMTVTVKVDGAEVETAGFTAVPSTDKGVTSFELANATDKVVTVAYTYTVTAGDVKAGKVTNTATVKAWNTDSTKSDEETGTSPEVETGKPDVNVSKTITKVGDKGYTAGMKAKVGDTIVWTITVTNSGTAAAENVVVKDFFQVGGIAATGLTIEGVSLNEKNEFTVASVPAGESVTYTASYTVVDTDKGKTITNSVAVKAGDTDPTEPTEPDTKIEVENKSVKVEKHVISGAANGATAVGKTLVYSIKVTNNGNVDLENVTISDTLTYSDGTPVKNGTHTFTINSLPKGDKQILTYSYEVQPSDAGKTLRNVAVAEADGKDVTDPTDPENPDKPTNETKTEVGKRITDVSKTLATEGYTVADNVEVNEDGQLVVVDNSKAITLRYAITVKGDNGAAFKVTDSGATLVENQNGVSVDADGKFVGTIENGSVTFIVTMQFNKNADGTYGDLSNKATVEAGDNGTEIPGTTDPEPEAKVFTVSYEYNGTVPAGAAEQLPATVIVEAGKTVTVAEKATAPGYDFSGWKIGGATYDADTEVTVNSDLTFVGSFTANEAKIVFVTNGGSQVADMTGTTGADVPNYTTMPETTKAGYKFDGWYANEALTGNAVTQLPEKFPAGTTTYYAKWTELDNVTIKYVAGANGTVSNDKDELNPETGVASGSTATAAAGYHFVNWTKVVDDKTVEVSDKAAFVPAKENGLNVAATYTAHFAEDANVTITYVAGKGGSVSAESETLAPATGEAEGSIATAEAGYKFVNWTDAKGNVVGTEATFVPEKVGGLNVAGTYYAKFIANTDTKYTVKHYKQNQAKDGYTLEDTDNLEGTTGTYVYLGNGVEQKTYTGYKFNPTVRLNGEDVKLGGQIAGDGSLVLKLYYDIDENATKDLTYTVEYYKDGEKVDADTQTVKQTVQVLEPDTLTVKPVNTANDKYVGYKFNHTDPAEIPTEVDGTKSVIIKVYYVTDPDAKKELSYTVEYYKDGVKVGDDTQTETAKVQVLQPDTLEVKKGEINTTDKYVGYKFDKFEIGNAQYAEDKLPDAVDKGTTIKVYYVTDAKQTKELSYTVEYYKDNVKVDADTQTEKQTVQVLQPDTLTVKPVNTANDKYVGYKFDKTEPATIPETIAKDGVIKVYYVKDTTNTHSISARVEYYTLESADANLNTAALKATDTPVTGDATWIGYEATVTVSRDKTKTFVGYKLMEGQKDSETFTLVENAETDNGANNVLKVYYVKDETQQHTVTAKVVYYQVGSEADVGVSGKETLIGTGDSATGITWIGSKVTVEVKVQPKEMFEGYKYLGYVDGTNGLKKENVNTLTHELAAWADSVDEYVIKVYYVKDTTATRDLTYTVKFYKVVGETATEVHTDRHDETAQVWVNDPANVTVPLAETVKGLITEDKYIGYKLRDYKVNNGEATTTLPETVKNGDVIEVFYVVDESKTHELSYTVVYHKGNEVVKSETVTKTVQVLLGVLPVDKDAIVDNGQFTGDDAAKFTGYKFEKITIDKARYDSADDLVKLVPDDTTINVFYVTDANQTKDLTYTVEYRVDSTTGTLLASESNTVQVWVNDTTFKVESVTAKTFTGYKLAETGSTEVPADVANNGVIYVIYTEDAKQTQETKYTVKHVVAGVEKDSQTYTGTAWVNATEPTIAIVKDSLAQKTYTGYKFDSMAIDGVTLTTEPTEVKSGTTIILTYVKDTEGQTQPTSYTVKHVVAGEVKDSKDYTSTAWINETNPMITIVKDSLNQRTYEGYKYVNTSVADGTTEVASGTTITLTYVKDDSQTKATSYTVKHVVGDVEQTADTRTYTGTAWINETNPMIAIQNGSLAEKTYTGYRFDSMSVTEGTKEVVSGTTITLTYVKDEGQTQPTKYTVHYTIEGDERTSDKLEVKSTAWVNDDPAQIAIAEGGIPAPANKYEGYVLDPFNSKYPEAGTKVDSGAEYTVNYLKDSNKDGIADKYQLKVTFQVKNGTWNDGTTEDQVIYLDKLTNGVFDVKGTATVPENKVPTGLTKPDKDYKAEGAWTRGEESVTTPANMVLTEDTVFVFTYTKDGEMTLTATGYKGTYNAKDNKVLTAGPTVTGPDGKPLEDVTFTYTVDGKPVEDIDKLTVKDVQELTIEITAHHAAYNDKTISVTAQVTPARLTITTEDASKTYNGTALTAPGKIEGLVDGETVTFKVTGSQTKIDKSDNTYELLWNGTAKKSNYEIVEDIGVLIVVPSDGTTTIINRPSGGGDGGTDIPDDDVPLANVDGNLNTTDHFAYIIGRGEDCVQPLENITRAEVATIFFRLLTEEYRVANWSTVSSFPDVDANAWFSTEIATAEKAGILKGCGDGTMQPNRNITRAEFAAMAVRFLNGTITDDGVGDFSDTANHWAAKEIRMAAKAGWVKGDGNAFRPNDPITRAEVMAIVNRMLDRVPGETFPAGTIEWKDNPKGTWYYADVMEATNGHDYEREEGSVVEKWTKITPYRDWIALEAEWTANNGASAKKEKQ